jgi:Glycosyltransferase family 87
MLQIMDDSPLYQRKKYRILLWILLVVSLVVLAQLAPTLSKPQYFSGDDFMTYWAGGKLILSGENPYDPLKKEALQLELGDQATDEDLISIMLNPPWVVTLVMPFGLLSYPISRLAWLLLSIGSILFCTQILWNLYKGPPKQRWISWIIILLFAPSILVLRVGQISTLLLLGITLFLYFIVLHENDWAAGIAIALISLKPQVIFIFLLALLFWIIEYRRWKILASSIASVLLLTLVALVFNHQIIYQYIAMLNASYIPDLATPTIGSYLRFFWLGTDKFWLQFLPTILGIVWFIYYWNRKHKAWNWLEELPILLLISILTASYSWTYDLVILIPAVLQAAIWLLSDWKRWSTFFLVLYFLCINILYLILHKVLNDFWFFWMAPAILVWYLLIKKTHTSHESRGN